MLKKQFMILALSISLSLSFNTASLASASTVTMENSGAYLFTWRPVDCGNGQSFAILVGGNTLLESNVVLNRGYDYGYTFNPTTYARPWGQVPDLVNVNGVWGIPENWSVMPEGSQPTTRIVLLTNNKNFSSNERYIDVVHLPENISPSDLPPEVRKYLINVDGSDAGAYDGTITSGWIKEGNQWKYRKADGTYVANTWLAVDEKQYYLNESGIMLADTITPDGIYVNGSGARTGYIPGWKQDGEHWRYLMKNGYYAAATWIQDADGKWYYFDLRSYMVTDDITPDGYYVDTNGVWNGQVSTIPNSINLGPGKQSVVGWESVDDRWKYKQEDGTYVTNAWVQDNGNWYYFNEDSLMVTEQETPDGYYVNSDGIWVR